MNNARQSRMNDSLVVYSAIVTYNNPLLFGRTSGYKRTF
jgi:hypothetical protein